MYHTISCIRMYLPATNEEISCDLRRYRLRSHQLSIPWLEPSVPWWPFTCHGTLGVCCCIHVPFNPSQLRENLYKPDSHTVVDHQVFVSLYTRYPKLASWSVVVVNNQPVPSKLFFLDQAKPRRDVLTSRRRSSLGIAVHRCWRMLCPFQSDQSILLWFPS